MRSRAPRLVVASACIALVVVASWTGLNLVLAARVGTAGKGHLLAAESAIAAGDPIAARTHLQAAGAAFAAMKADIGRLGPLLGVARAVPLVRVQVQGIEAFASAGGHLAAAGVAVVDAGHRLTEPTDERALAPLAEALTDLGDVADALARGVEALDAAAAEIDALEHRRLIGPLDDARITLATRLPGVQTRARAARAGIDALVTFAGGDGPRRYLLLSQNPDEPRPTGGFIGSFGVLAADGGRLGIERYDGIEAWATAHPDLARPAAETPTAFTLPEPDVPQRLANVNATPDWPAATALALDLWQRGGEQPAHGAVGFTPELLARLLVVTGPVQPPGYPGPAVTAANVIERLDAETHGPDAPSGADRKDFLGVLGEAVFRRLLDTPASRWGELARAVTAAFDARELTAHTTDPTVAATLASEGWDFTLPETPGDFFFASEFAYVAKNGRGLVRHFDHTVALRADGSARVQTVMTLTNTLPASTARSGYNPDSQAYVTLYGPAGATLAGGDEPVTAEPALAGHPAAGWLRAADPLGATSLTVVWDAPALGLRQDGDRTSLVYRLWWMTGPARAADTLTLTVIPPPGYEWATAAPPASATLARDLRGQWTLRRAPR